MKNPDPSSLRYGSVTFQSQRDKSRQNIQGYSSYYKWDVQETKDHIYFSIRMESERYVLLKKKARARHRSFLGDWSPALNISKPLLFEILFDEW